MRLGSMRLVGRWIWASVVLLVCFISLLLLRHGTVHKEPKWPNSRLRNLMSELPPSPSYPTSQSTLETLPLGPKMSTTATATTIMTEAPITTTQPPLADVLPDYQKLCWKSGFSPKSGTPTNHTSEDFIVNEMAVCSGKLLFLVLVHSDIGHRQRRDLIRHTWASLNNVNGHRLAVVFIIGAIGDPKQQAALLEESAGAADLVQVPCRPEGDPRVSACKALYSLLWVTRHCPGAEFLLKVDDHVFVNVFHLAALITGRLAGANNTFYCRTAANEGRISNERYAWYVSQEEWPSAEYPVHCKGQAYLMSADLAPRLLRCAAWRNYMRLEDVYITGVLGEAVGAQLLHWTRGWDFDWLHPKHDGPAVASAVFLATQEGAPLPTLHKRVWKAALQYSADFI